MINPGIPEQMAGYMLIVNPLVCPTCMARYPEGTKACKICGRQLVKK